MVLFMLGGIIMNTEALINMYIKLDDDDYKALVIDQCKHSGNQYHLYLILENKKVPDIAKIYITDFIVDNCDISIFYKYTANSIISQSSRHISETLLNYMFEKIIYKNIIDKSVVNEIIILDIIYIMENNLIKLDYELLKDVHNKYGEHFFNNNLLKFDMIKSYCYAFNCYLTNSEKDTFFKRLQAKTRNKYIDGALEKIDFNEEQKQKLQSILILNEFTK